MLASAFAAPPPLVCQVLVSLQSMVFVPDPYFNEPGFERSYSTPAGKQASASYNAAVRLGTVSHALLPALRSPDAVFREALRVHYSHQGVRVRQLLQQWVRESKQDTKQPLQLVVKQVEQELSKLPPPPPDPQQQQQQAAVDSDEDVMMTGQQQQQQQPRRRRQRAQSTADVDVVDLT